MSKIFVIAGNKVQADIWIKKDIEKRISRGETTMSLSQYVFVDDANRLRGVRDPRGVFIGTWKDRWDIREVVETLLTQSVHVNPTLGKIWGEVKDRTKPKPKQPPLHKVNGGWSVAVEDAADMLAKEIDREVLQQLNGGTMEERQEQYSVAYQDIIPVLVKSLQELHSEVKELKNAGNVSP